MKIFEEDEKERTIIHEADNESSSGGSDSSQSDDNLEIEELIKIMPKKIIKKKNIYGKRKIV